MLIEPTEQKVESILDILLRQMHTREWENKHYNNSGMCHTCEISRGQWNGAC